MAYVLVQSQTTNTTTIGYLSDATVSKVSTTFTALESYSPTKITLGLMKQGTVTGNITVQIYAIDASKYPTGSPLATSDTTLTNTTLTTSLANYDFIFTSLASLVYGTRYAIVITSTFVGDAVNRIIIKGAASAGDRLSKYTGSWATESDNYTGIYYIYKTTGWSYKIQGITPAKVNNVAVANISKVNGA